MSVPFTELAPPPPLPLPQASVSPPGAKEVGLHSQGGKRAGEANTDDLRGSLALGLLSGPSEYWVRRKDF